MNETEAHAPVLIVGATSDIAIALAHVLAGRGHSLHLAARAPEQLAQVATDLAIRYRVGVETLRIDVTDTGALKRQIEALTPQPRIIVSMVGAMGDQTLQQADPEQVRAVIEANFTGPAALMEAGAALFATVAEPTVLVGVCSVAGDRGRARNYYYGSAKAAFATMLSGLRQRLARSNTTVITVKPGFVATRMTAGMDLPKVLVASDAECATMIADAIKRRRQVVYPMKWRLLMTTIGLIPEPIFKRLSF